MGTLSRLHFLQVHDGGDAAGGACEFGTDQGSTEVRVRVETEQVDYLQGEGPVLGEPKKGTERRDRTLLLEKNQVVRDRDPHRKSGVEAPAVWV